MRPRQPRFAVDSERLCGVQRGVSSVPGDVVSSDKISPALLSVKVLGISERR